MSEKLKKRVKHGYIMDNSCNSFGSMGMGIDRISRRKFDTYTAGNSDNSDTDKSYQGGTCLSYP